MSQSVYFTASMVMMDNFVIQKVSLTNRAETSCWIQIWSLAVKDFKSVKFLLRHWQLFGLNANPFKRVCDTFRYCFALVTISYTISPQFYWDHHEDFNLSFKTTTKTSICPWSETLDQKRLVRSCCSSQNLLWGLRTSENQRHLN